MSEQIGRIGRYRIEQRGEHRYALSGLRRCVAWTRPVGEHRTEIRVLATHQPPEPWRTDRSLPRYARRTDGPLVQSYVVPTVDRDRLLERILLTASVEAQS